MANTDDTVIVWVPKKPHDREFQQECGQLEIHLWALRAPGKVECLHCGLRREQRGDDQIVAKRVSATRVLARWLSRRSDKDDL